MRLIDADELENYAYEPEFGIKDEIENQIAESSIPVDVKIEYDEELEELCRKVLESCMNVIKTEPTAYDVDKVVRRLEEERNQTYRADGSLMWARTNISIDKAIEIVKFGGIECQKNGGKAR